MTALLNYVLVFRLASGNYVMNAGGDPARRLYEGGRWLSSRARNVLPFTNEIMFHDGVQLSKQGAFGQAEVRNATVQNWETEPRALVAAHDIGDVMDEIRVIALQLESARFRSRYNDRIRERAANLVRTQIYGMAEAAVKRYEKG